MRVVAIIVCFNPDLAKVEALAATLVHNGVQVVIVDNSSISDLHRLRCASDCIIVPMGVNRGIAAAQNEGIRLARAHDAEIVLFFDQDSTIAPDFVGRLLAHSRPNEPHVVAPRGIDDQSGEELEAMRVIAGGRVKSIKPGNGVALVRVDIVISSGMAVTAAALDIVGEMNPDLFIDLVDTEWCLRARASGVPVEIVTDAVMEHRIGSRSVRRLGMTVLVHSPRRCYYQIRNPLLLFRMRHVPKLFALTEFASIMISRLLLLGAVSERTAYATHILDGLRDGVLGRAGPYPGNSK